MQTLFTICVPACIGLLLQSIFAQGAVASGHSVADITRESFGAFCRVSSPMAALTLEGLIERMLCRDPRALRTLANANAYAASVDIERSAYLPRIDATAGAASTANDTVFEQSSERSRHGHQRRFDSRVNLSWVLYDFGQRESAVRRARQLMLAANAEHDSQLQEVFIQAARLYYQALTAKRSLQIARQVALLAAQNAEVANVRYAAGVAALADSLQAQAAYSQARLNELRAEGTLSSTMGVIALQVGLPVQTPLELAGDLGKRASVDFIKGIDALIAQALQQHPSLVAARANVDAARAAIEQSRAAGRPSLSFVSSISASQTEQTMAFGGDVRVRDNSIGLQLSVPLFAGFGPTHQVRKAQAQLEAAQAQLSITEQHLALQVWGHYQTLKTESDAVAKAAEWVEQATHALKLTQGRYHSGVGNVIELLSAMSAYATAEQHHVQALNTWQMTRLELARGLGDLGAWTL